jgi:hypothetical protein
VSLGLVQACLQGEANIRRARSLFADAQPTSAPAEAAQSLADAADTTVAAGQRTSDLSGVAINAHHQFVNTSTPVIIMAARNDLTFGAHLDAAAAITRAGADQLDAIAQQASATTQAAAAARSPAAQRVVLAAMQSHVQAASSVVETTRSQAAAIAAGVRQIEYEQGPPGAGADDFNLDTQYARPLGFTAPPPAGTVEITGIVTGTVYTAIQTVNITMTWTGASNGKHCKK